MSKDLKPALRAAADTLGKIIDAVDARRLLARGVVNEVLRKGLKDRLLSDEEIGQLAGDGFEAAVIALSAVGDPDVAIFECGKEDITP